MDINTISTTEAFAGFFARDGLFPWLKSLIEQMESGNVCIDTNVFSESQFHDIQILQNHALVGSPEDNKPFVFHNQRLYINRYFHYEKALVEQIKALCYPNEVEMVAKVSFLHQQKSFISKKLFQPNNRLKTTDWQLVACLSAFLSRFTIISGGPGTGKTTTVAKLLYLFLLEHPELKIGVCAPTGKASARLDESFANAASNLSGSEFQEDLVQKITGLKALTIHSMLGYRHSSIHFKHHEKNTLDLDILIVDECSMIDITMFYKLFVAIDVSRTKVILLGDKNQLASVEAGSVFRDLCNDTAPMNIFSEDRIALINSFVEDDSTQIPMNHEGSNISHPLFQRMIELQTSFRFNDDEGIGRFSKAILNNDVPVINEFLENNDEKIRIEVPSKVDDEVKKAAGKLRSAQGGFVGENSKEAALSRLTKSIVLCAVKEGKAGVLAVNQVMATELSRTHERYYPWLPIMVTANQQREGVFNGDIGLVLQDQSGLYVYFPKGSQEPLSLNPAQIREWDPAYAMTIHKSQGSEFDEVLIILPDNKENLLLTRELLYTAITRARENVTIIGSVDVITTIAGNSVKRVSGIADHFKA